MQAHRLKSLLTPGMYAKKKGVSKQAVWYRINKGDIDTVAIGQHKDIYIDWRKFKDYPFEIDNVFSQSPKASKF